MMANNPWPLSIRPPDRHASCARCGVADATVDVTPVRDGEPWPPTCSECSTKMRRIKAVERAAEAGA